MSIAKRLRLRPDVVILAVLIAYFLCTSGVMSESFSFPRDVTLTSPKTSDLYTNAAYVFDQESSAAGWLKTYGVNIYAVYSNLWARFLISQSGIPDYRLKATGISNYQATKTPSDYFFLRYREVVMEEPVDQAPAALHNVDRIYDNGGSQIFK